jgi:hypothetical protein
LKATNNTIMPIMYIPIHTLNYITKEFPIRITGLDAMGYAAVQNGDPNPVVDQPRHMWSRRTRATTLIRDQFFEEPNGPQRYLIRITTYPDHDDSVYEYIYIRKSVDWLSSTLIAEVTLQEFETRRLDYGQEVQDYYEINCPRNDFAWFASQPLRPARQTKRELSWPNLYRPSTPHPVASGSRIHEEEDDS